MIRGPDKCPSQRTVIPVSIYNEVFASNAEGDAGRRLGPVDGPVHASAVSFRATEAARFAFLAAVKGMTHGEQPLDIDYLIRLTDRLLEAHHQAVMRPSGPRLPAEDRSAEIALAC